MIGAGPDGGSIGPRRRRRVLGWVAFGAAALGVWLVSGWLRHGFGVDPTTALNAPLLVLALGAMALSPWIQGVDQVPGVTGRSMTGATRVTLVAGLCGLTVMHLIDRGKPSIADGWTLVFSMLAIVSSTPRDAWRPDDRFRTGFMTLFASGLCALLYGCYRPNGASWMTAPVLLCGVLALEFDGLRAWWRRA